MTSCKKKNTENPKIIDYFISKILSNGKHRCFIDLENGSYQNVESFYKKLGENMVESFKKMDLLDFLYIMKN